MVRIPAQGAVQSSLGCVSPCQNYKALWELRIFSSAKFLSPHKISVSSPRHTYLVCISGAPPKFEKVFFGQDRKWGTHSFLDGSLEWPCSTVNLDAGTFLSCHLTQHVCHLGLLRCKMAPTAAQGKKRRPPKKSDSANPTVFTENWSKPASFIKSAPAGPVGFQKKSAAA
jgi:hypothetical protein